MRALLDTSVLIGGEPPGDVEAAISVASLTELHHGVLVATDDDERGRRIDRLAAVETAFDRCRSLPRSRARGGASSQRPPAVAALPAVARSAALVALLLVGASGSYWVERRRREVAFLASRGARPAQLAGKAVLEMLPWTAAGALGGWAAAVGLVRLLAQSPLISAGVPVHTLPLVAAGLVGGLLLLALVAGLRARAFTEARVGHRRSAWRWVPVELLAVAAGVLLLRHDVQGGNVITTDQSGTVSRISPALPGVPLLLLVGVTGAAVRVVLLSLHRLRPRGDGGRPVLLLALQRLVSSPALTALLLDSAILSAGVFTYARTAAATATSSLEQKAHVFVGGDVAALTHDPVQVPGLVPDHFTDALAVDQAALTGLAGTSVLGVDVDTFADQAYWNPPYADRSLPALLAAISDPGRVAPVPALLIGGPAGTTRELTIAGRASLAVHVVATPRHFPTERQGQPLLVVDRRALAPYSLFADHLLIGSGDAPRLVELLTEAGLPQSDLRLTSAVLDPTGAAGVSWAFGFLSALAAFTGVVGAAGLFLYLDARSRARRLAYVIIRRIGLTRRAHVASLLLELGTVLLGGAVFGAACGYACALLIAGGLDILPDLTPPLSMLVPPAAYAAAIGAAAVLTLLGATVAQHAADRARPAEVVRE